MNRLLIIFASLSLLASTAWAGPRCGTNTRIVGYTSCGMPIVATLERVGYSRCGEPIFNWVTHDPREGRHVHHSSHHHHGSHHSPHRSRHWR